MSGFKKYERLLKKKAKVEAFLNLITEEGKETLDTLNINETDVSRLKPIHETNGDTSYKTIKEEYRDSKKKADSKWKNKWERPHLQLEMKGIEALLDSHSKTSIRNPLSVHDLQHLLMLALTPPEDQNMDNYIVWCTLNRRKYISRVVLVIVDGLGVSELATIYDNPEKEHDTDEEDAIEAFENSIKIRQPPCKKRKIVKDDETKRKIVKDDETKREIVKDDEIKREIVKDDETKRKIVKDDEIKRKIVKDDETSLREDSCGVSKLVDQALPKSSPLFAYHMDVEAPTQSSKEPFFMMFSLKRKVIGELVEDVLERAEKLEEEMLIKEIEHRDMFSRKELLLSVQEMNLYNYPMIVEGNYAYKDPYFQPLHPVVEKVTHKSPMFGIDCEMCLTKRGSELTHVSVVDEKLKLLYKSYVKPPRSIVHYLTTYSGVTKEHLKNVKTNLNDVQNALRLLLPKDAILVGHSLNNDLSALKLCHPYVIDTSIIFNTAGARVVKPSLKLLAKIYLKKDIQKTTLMGHDPTEDAAASLELVLLKLRNGIKFGDRVKLGGNFEFPCTEMLSLERLYRKNKNFKKLNLTKDIFQCALNFDHKVALVIPSCWYGKLWPYYNQYGQGFHLRNSDTKNVLPVATTDHTDEKFLVCYCPMKYNFLNPSIQNAKEELSDLDEKLFNLRQSLPQHSLVITWFTGSPSSVPLEKRSNGICLIELVGQERKKPYAFLS